MRVLFGKKISVIYYGNHAGETFSSLLRQTILEWWFGILAFRGLRKKGLFPKIRGGYV